MKLNFYNAFYSQKQKRYCPGVQPMELDEVSFKNITEGKKTRELCEAYQKGDAGAKSQLPAFCWTGRCKEGTTRAAANMEPTHLYMVDIDHCDDARGAWSDIRQLLLNEWSEHQKEYGIRLVHVTPSGKGLRIVAECTQDFPTLKEHMEWLCEELELDKYGDFDSCVKDLSRLSFAVPADYILFQASNLFEDVKKTPIERASNSVVEHVSESKTPSDGNVANDIEEHRQEYEGYKEYTFKGTRLTTIIDKYLEVYGQPCDGEKHNFYNQMVKNFRCIADNNPRILHALLPRFGGNTDDEYYKTLSQCQSICRTNTLSKLPRDFYFFMLENDFLKRRTSKSEQELDDYMLNAPEFTGGGIIDSMPKLPPVFREIVGTMPDDFKIPAINALMPIMGTLTSHLRAEYPFDHRMHSTEFFSIIYAPPSTGKSFMEKHMELIFEDLKMRDMLSNEREALYNKLVNRKGSNEKSPDNPRVTLRLVQPKQSETDFLEKQQANKGHHMFTYAAEMDSWRKGVKAAGGNKDDMIRIAWDNGEYGQNFKSPNSFKGNVNLFWNVLICGTLDQINAYFQNVENGLVTRCCFTSIENQEFVDIPPFKKLSKRDIKVITEWRTRMDACNYKDPLEFDMSSLFSINEDDFDKEVPWRYEWKPTVTIDISWIMPTLKKFLKEQLNIAAVDVDHARDVFRRRTAVRGFRLAMLCTTLYKNVDKKAQKEICKFVEWWLEQDINGIHTLFAERYNAIYDNSITTKVTQQSVFDLLDETFTRNDVLVATKKLGKKTKARRIIFDWKKVGAIVEEKEGEYRKKKSKK